ncbi:MAG: DNA primase [Phycisphaerae bacterium]|nr:DNA primase [Phycisphaerae bacterium]|tara:strand:- start:2063 stop:3946 length:1884 start_codon:yes stop_codon:yes gene_type:complete
MADRVEIDRVREATNLVEVIGSHVALEPKGREHVGLCPFHDDNSPSMAVVTHKTQAFYKCHSCGASGDVFKFLMNYLRIDFPEALNMLAERAGITLSTRRSSPEDRERRSMRERIRNSNDAATVYFQKVLAHPEHGRTARSMIESREISDAMVSDFQIGCAPSGWDGMLKAIGNRPDAVESALAAGLLRSRQERSGGDGNYDYFRNRLMFPICNESGQPIAFGGRILDPEDNPKYLNSPETELFNKSRTLYGLHLARKAIMDAGTAIVTEGYTDVIACHQAGFRNVVGTLGTAMTDEHAKLLSRIADTVVLLFDGDEAGQRAAERGAEVMLRHPVDVRVCILPDGTDPADLLTGSEGNESFRDLLDRSEDVLHYMLQRFERSIGKNDSMSGRQHALELFIGELGRIGLAGVHGIRKSLLMNRLADLMNVSLGTIETMLGGASDAHRTAPIGTPSINPLVDTDIFTVSDRTLTRARQLAEKEYLGVLLFEPEAPGREAIPLLTQECFLDGRTRLLAAELLPRINEGKLPTVQDLHGEVSDDNILELASHLWFLGERQVTEPTDEYDPRSPLQRVTEALQACMDHAHTEQRLAHHKTSQKDDPGAVLDIIQHLRDQGPRVAAIHRDERS